MHDLSEAVVHWLEYQRCIGIDQFLNESALTIPIVGYLTSDGWEIKKETDYWNVCDGVTRGKCYADFSFVRGNEMLILETKFFKSSSQNKVFDDFVRLALPSKSSLRRVALVAFSRANPPWGPYNALLKLQDAEFIELDPNKRALRCGGETFSLNYNEKQFAKLLGYIQTPLAAIKVTCSQRADSRKYGAMLFTVERLA